MEIDGAAGGLTIGPSRSGSIAPPKPKCAAPITRTRLSIKGVGGVDPVAPQRPHRRSRAKG
jgi:hypothetical protein